MNTRRRVWLAPTMLVMLIGLPRTAQAGYGPPNGNGKPPVKPNGTPVKPKGPIWNYRVQAWLKTHRGR